MLRLFINRMLSGELRTKREELTGHWKKIHGLPHRLLLVNQSHYRPEVPGGFQEIKVLRLGDNGPG